MRIARSLWNTALESIRAIGGIYNPPLASTLNELYNIQAVETRESNEIEHFIIGLSAESLLENGTLELKDTKHNPYDGNVFIRIPFLMKPENVDITVEERNTYKLFTKLTIGNTVYNVAYAKRLGNRDSTPTLNMLTIVNTTTTVKDLNATEDTNIDFLHPSPVKDENLYPAEQQYVTTKAMVSLSISKEEKVLIRSYIDIIYPNRVKRKYFLGELILLQNTMGIVAGHSEILKTQPAYFITRDVNLELDDKDMKMSLDIGGKLPLVVS